MPAGLKAEPTAESRAGKPAESNGIDLEKLIDLLFIFYLREDN